MNTDAHTHTNRTHCITHTHTHIHKHTHIQKSSSIACTHSHTHTYTTPRYLLLPSFMLLRQALRGRGRCRGLAHCRAAQSVRDLACKRVSNRVPHMSTSECAYIECEHVRIYLCECGISWYRYQRLCPCHFSHLACPFFPSTCGQLENSLLPCRPFAWCVRTCSLHTLRALMATYKRGSRHGTKGF
jgi:hypothetical protein